MSKKILAFAGSNSKQSINARLINSVVGMVDFAEVDNISIRSFDLPLYGIDYEKEIGIPDDAHKFNDLIKKADAFIISTPEHNGSLPVAFKNVIDWVSRIDNDIFNDKPMVLLSSSPGKRGGLSSLGHAESILSRLGAEILGTYAFGSFKERYNNGSLDEEAQLEINNLLAKLEDKIN